MFHKECSCPAHPNDKETKAEIIFFPPKNLSLDQQSTRLKKVYSVVVVVRFFFSVGGVGGEIEALLRGRGEGGGGGIVRVITF